VGQYRNLLAEDEARSGRVALLRQRAEKRSTLKHPDEWLISALGGSPTSSGARVGESTAMGLPVVQACVGILADMVGLLPCKLYRKTSDGREEEVEHSAHTLISGSPNGHHTAFEFRRFLQTGVGLGGNGYARVYRDSYYDPVRIEPLLPCEVKPEKLADKRIVYRVEGERSLLTRADIIHVPGLSTDGVMGISPIRTLRESMGLALTMQEQAGRMFKNGAQFGGYIEAPPNTKPETLQAMSDQWERRHAGAHNAGKTPWLLNGTKYTSVQGMTMQDAEFLASRRFQIEEIARAYRVPLFLLNSTDKSTTWGSGLEQMNQGFLQYSLNPWLVCTEQAFDITLLSAAEIASGYYFKFNRGALLQAALEAQANFFTAMRNIGVYSPNDVRRKLEENDIPGGDSYDKPFNGQGGVAAKPSNEPKEEPQEAAA
jgi:HK97 family phage portal protein